MPTLSDASSMPVWDLRTWVFVAVAVCILGPVLLLIALAHEKRDHQRRVDRGATVQPRPARANCQVTTGCTFPGFIPVYLTREDMTSALACVGCHDRGLVMGWSVNANEWDRHLDQDVTA